MGSWGLPWQVGGQTELPWSPQIHLTFAARFGVSAPQGPKSSLGLWGREQLVKGGDPGRRASTRAPVSLHSHLLVIPSLSGAHPRACPALGPPPPWASTKGPRVARTLEQEQEARSKAKARPSYPPEGWQGDGHSWGRHPGTPPTWAPQASGRGNQALLCPFW